MAHPKIKRALISVYDKTGIVEFARALVDEFGIEIISTGGTAKHLKENGIPVTLVEDVTGFPEMLDGRVKTLHPKIHAAILADRDNAAHMRQLAEQGIKPIDMVVVNLYPFEKTIADPNCTFERAIEMIDIGGPCLLRAAAKNHKYVLPVYDAEAYTEVLRVMRGEWKHDEIYLRYASGVFGVASCYDGDVAKWLGKQAQKFMASFFPIACYDWGPLRYGENPHQQARLLQPVDAAERCNSDEAGLVFADENNEQLEMSFNNYADSHAALELCKELARSAPNVGPTFQSVIKPISLEQHSERHLPHIQNPGSHYFVTFRLKSGTLSIDERQVVLDACKHWHKDKMTVHACVIMPDHVHLLLTPHDTGQHQWVPLGEITRSIKGYSAREINKLRGTTGALWLDESFDRIMRNEKEFGETWEYIEYNPSKAGLGEDYEWLWLNRHSWEDLAAYYDRLESRSHIQSKSQLQSHAESGSHGKISRLSSVNPVCAFIKHSNPCGVGSGETPIKAYESAYIGDSNAAMGGVLACNFSIDREFAATVMDSYAKWGKDAGAGGFFIEVWVAPSFDDDAVEVIRTAKPWGQRVRLLAVGDMTAPPNPEEQEYKSITGGMLVQERDLLGLNEDQWKVVTKRKPTESEMSDLRLAWLIAKHTKSNAISICKDGMLIGNGAGQMSRVMSCRIATWLAKENRHEDKLKGSVAASDAFFPFADGPKILVDAGVSAIIQPGGSKRDDETIALCDERGVAMIFTGTRHFKH